MPHPTLEAERQRNTAKDVRLEWDDISGFRKLLTQG